ncbi:MAG TPA: hypothetical protein PK156_41420 [Polyangium sp.]|nr:hypothetical protein [Polyangium sp.]
MGKLGLTLDLTGRVPIMSGRGIRADIIHYGAGLFFVQFDQNFDTDEYIVGATITGGVSINPQAAEITAFKIGSGTFFWTAVDDVPTDLKLDIDFAVISQTTQSCAMVDGGIVPTMQATRGFKANIERLGIGYVRLVFDAPLAPNEYAVNAVIREPWAPGLRYVIVAVKGMVGDIAFIDVMTWSNSAQADLSFDIFTERFR